MSFELCTNCNSPKKCLDDIRWACAMVDACITVADEDAEIIGPDIAYSAESLKSTQDIYDRYTQKFKERQCGYDADRLKYVITTIIDSIS